MDRKLSQFVSEVVNFSSQYGTQGSRSYTACNLEGGLNIYDGYGDRTEAFVLRTYGLWWRNCPSAALRVRNSMFFRSQDFVEVRFEIPVIPTSIDIYETYHPGAVVRILACNSNPLSTHRKRQPGEVEWVTLWSGPTQCSDEARSRKFSPPLRKITFPTNLLRLEFNSEECGYYTELDGVELHGYKRTAISPFRDRAIGFKMSITNQLLKTLSLSDRQISTGDDDSDDDYMNKWGYFSLLPDELIQYIFKQLDLRSLCTVPQVCSLFLKNAYDPLLYNELDLQPFWNTVDNIALEGLQSRCGKLCYLNLSWTGGGGQVTEQSVCRFVKECGNGLEVLNLACCKYVGEETLSTIGSVCTSLKALDMQSCLQLSTELHHIGKLNNLQRLNLYCCRISAPLLHILGRNCHALKHLNIGASVTEGPVGDSDLNKCLENLKNLVSLDLWRCKFASTETILTIARSCKSLEEIDVGWCHKVLRVQFNHKLFFGNCTKLKKVFLTSGRIIDDDCLKSIATFCTNMEQLDILGSNQVTTEGVASVLQRCPKLKLFDLSFCSKIQDVSEFVVKYPKVAFKKSFQ